MSTRESLHQRCTTIEETYEFTLAYAAQGLPGDAGSPVGGQLREYLARSVAALDGLAAEYGNLVMVEDLQPAEQYRAFIDVLDRDAQAALAAMRLVLAQPSISSQLVDNLNASIHLRALLTDIFLIDEILATGGDERASAP
jgi:hypothetical protein